MVQLWGPVYTLTFQTSATSVTVVKMYLWDICLYNFFGVVHKEFSTEFAPYFPRRCLACKKVCENLRMHFPSFHTLPHSTLLTLFTGHYTIYYTLQTIPQPHNRCCISILPTVNQPTNCGPWNQLLKEAAKGRTDFQHLWELRNYWWVGKIHYWISPQGASFSSALGVYWLLVFVQLFPQLLSPETQTKCGQLIHSSIYQPI